MVKVSCDKDELNFEVLEGTPLEVSAELQTITVEAINLMTNNQPEFIRRLMIDMYCKTLEDVLKELI